MSISVHQLNKYYGEQCVLNKVSFEIGSGEIVGFLGPNGAGKSTMMKIITGYVPFNEGSVKVCNVDVQSNPIETKRMIGYLPEHNPLYLEMYVKEYLQFVGGIYRLGKGANARVDEMIERTGLTPEYKKRIGQLSKGYRQRVGLAQALLPDPQVLILDEPTTGLDPNQLVEVRNLIAEIGKEKTVLLSTHIMQEVSALCGRVLIINKGNIVADEKADNIVSISQQKSQLLTVELDKHIDEKEFMTINGVLSAKQLKPLHYQVECTKDIRAEVFRLIADKGLTLLTLNQQERNMEDVFHELTNAK
ncbi:MAG: gliding motility-associated ABC transporter ATP-binding subunit GldA [Paludibacteraceae bacterium]|nr:gliding motility-associated ABC transporter ATP-binding subunit GldA [Paludibacteraceae bacterium]